MQMDAPIAVRQDASEAPADASPLEGEGQAPPPEFENAAKREHLSEAVALKQLRHDAADKVRAFLRRLTRCLPRRGVHLA